MIPILREQLHNGLVVAPGVYDALTATIASDAGFQALYVSGAAIAYTKLGRPDVGLVSMSEVADTVALMRDRVTTPLIVDADDGYGNALNVLRTVRMFERAGASAIQFEDQAMPKRCGHLRDKVLVSAETMVGKLHAALDARASHDTLIIARTDAVAVDGIAAAIDRAGAYAEAGADILFVEAPQSREELEAVTAGLAGMRPLMVNIVDGGDTPPLPRAELERLGFRLVIFPGGIVRALARTAQAYYASLAQHGSNLPFADRMFDFNQLNDLIGTPELLALGKAYAAGGGA